MDGKWRARLLAALGVLAAAAFTACGDDTTPATQTAAKQDGNAAGILLSVPQAEQAARDWWARDEQSLLQRKDAPPLDQLVAVPEGTIRVHQLAVSQAIGHPLLAAARQPQSVHVYVPAQQSWPVFVLAVFELPAKSGSERLATLLVKTDAASPLRCQETAVLDGPEPQFDVDANGLVRTVAPADQPMQLGRAAADLSTQYAAYLTGVATGHPQTPAAFAPGRHTSEVGRSDADEIRSAPSRSHGVIAGVDVAYAGTAFQVPVFALRGGGGFALFATQRTEVLHAAQGQQFFQDSARKNWGVDLAPGPYAQITRQSIVVAVARIAAAGAAVEVVGAGGGTFSEG